MSYIKTVSTKELAESKTNQVHRIHSLKEKLKNKNFTEYFPNEKMVMEALAFEKKEFNIIENELAERKEIHVMTIRISEMGVSFYKNVSFWEKWFYQYLEEDFGISHNRTMDLETFKDVLEKYGYTYYEEFIYSNVNEEEMIKELRELFEN
jgi:hypothetical protein